jgi:hypothetical protein
VASAKLFAPVYVPQAYVRVLSEFLTQANTLDLQEDLGLTGGKTVVADQIYRGRFLSQRKL